MKAVVVKVSDGGALVSFPSLMELHDKKASYSYFYKPYVKKILRRSQIEFSLDDYFTLNLEEAKQKAETNFSTSQQYKVAGAVIEDHFDEVMDYDEGSVTA